MAEVKPTTCKGCQYITICPYPNLEYPVNTIWCKEGKVKTGPYPVMHLPPPEKPEGTERVPELECLRNLICCAKVDSPTEVDFKNIFKEIDHIEKHYVCSIAPTCNNRTKPAKPEGA